MGSSGWLAAWGTASFANDDVQLQASGLPQTTTALFFQGTDQENGGAGSVFGDGLRCATGSVVRLGAKTAVAGNSLYPGPGDPTVSVKGGIPATGATRHYQVWYRNVAAYCTAGPFNLTNGRTIAWTP